MAGSGAGGGYTPAARGGAGDVGGGAAAISASGGAAEATLEGEGFKLSTLPPVPPAEVKRQCNCKNSRCLKLYCECFASGIYCDPSTCNCSACCNCKEAEAVRAEAIEATLERNANAFRPKIQTDGSTKHAKGCNCKKSNCLKKYCECFQAGILCSDACRCVSCKNFEGSKDRAAVLKSAARSNPAPKRRKIVSGIKNPEMNPLLSSDGSGKPSSAAMRQQQALQVARQRAKESPLYGLLDAKNVEVSTRKMLLRLAEPDARGASDDVAEALTKPLPVAPAELGTEPSVDQEQAVLGEAVAFLKQVAAQAERRAAAAQDTGRASKRARV